LRGGAERGEGVAALIEQALEHREAGAPARLVDGPAAEVADRARLAGDRAVRVEGAEEAADAAVVLDQRAEAAREERRDRVEVGEGGRTDAQRGAGRRRGRGHARTTVAHGAAGVGAAHLRRAG